VKLLSPWLLAIVQVLTAKAAAKRSPSCIRYLAFSLFDCGKPGSDVTATVQVPPWPGAVPAESSRDLLVAYDRDRDLLSSGRRDQHARGRRSFGDLGCFEYARQLSRSPVGDRDDRSWPGRDETGFFAREMHSSSCARATRPEANLQGIKCPRWRSSRFPSPRQCMVG
jgi:hypothetical protein